MIMNYSSNRRSIFDKCVLHAYVDPKMMFNLYQLSDFSLTFYLFNFYRSNLRFKDNTKERKFGHKRTKKKLNEEPTYGACERTKAKYVKTKQKISKSKMICHWNDIKFRVQRGKKIITRKKHKLKLQIKISLYNNFGSKNYKKILSRLG